MVSPFKEQRTKNKEQRSRKNREPRTIFIADVERYTLLRFTFFTFSESSTSRTLRTSPSSEKGF